ncbi:MAG: HD domain-containing protein [Pseudomonadota bacterium]
MSDFGDRFDDAMVFAASIHRGQVRKGTKVPYISHLLAVAALVIENGGNEDQAIAALLHDAVEDQGGLDMEATIRARYGDHVADIVMDCTDATQIPKPPWRGRKEAYIAALPEKSEESLLVSLCDKLHNARSITDDIDRVGPDLWTSFKGGRDGTLWYYRSVADFYLRRTPGFLADRLNDTVLEMEAKAGA